MNLKQLRISDSDNLFSFNVLQGFIGQKHPDGNVYYFCSYQYFKDHSSEFQPIDMDYVDHVVKLLDRDMKWVNAGAPVQIMKQGRTRPFEIYAVLKDLDWTFTNRAEQGIDSGSITILTPEGEFDLGLDLEELKEKNFIPTSLYQKAELQCGSNRFNIVEYDEDDLI